MYNRRYSKLVVFLAAVKSIMRENDESEELFKAICYRNSEKNEKEKPLFADSSCVIYQLKQRHRMEKTLQNRVNRRSKTLETDQSSKFAAFLFPFYRRRRFVGNIINDPINPFYLICDSFGETRKSGVRNGGIFCGHEVMGDHGA